MDELEQNNYAELCGTLAAPPVLSHENRQERFFTFPLETQRLSGTIDRVNVVVRERLLAEMPLEESARLCVIGDVRSFNNRRGPGAKLVITVFARDISLSDEPYDRNLILLSGTLCKPPNLRTTPAVPSGRSDRRLLLLMVPPSMRRFRFSPDTAVNISLDTTSVASPMPRTNRSVCSNIGVSMGTYP